ncbi:reverse transcriptase domain-containing protein [Tanacetum coccineum]
MIIEAEVGGHCIHRLYMDGGSALEILYEHCFNRLRLEIKNQLVPTTTPLIGFIGEIIWPIGQIQLLVTIRDEEHFASAWMNFVIVRSPSSYNGIIKRFRVRKLQAVPSTVHGMLKILVEGGVITLKSSRNLEVYVDVFVIKSRMEDEIVRDVEETFKTLRGNKECTKKSDFHWNMETEEAFKQMKQLIAELPMLVAPMEKEELIVYLAAAKETVSAVLMTERETKQMPIYFVSRALRADFIVERPEEDSLDTLMEIEEELSDPWILFMDGSSYTDGSGAGLILTNPEGTEFTYALRFRFDATKNKA